MKSVSIKAINIKVGDILNGRRICGVHKYMRRRKRVKSHDKNAIYGVLIVAPNPQGYQLDTARFFGHQRITVKRPKYNQRRFHGYV